MSFQFWCFTSEIWKKLKFLRKYKIIPRIKAHQKISTNFKDEKRFPRQTTEWQHLIPQQPMFALFNKTDWPTFTSELLLRMKSCPPWPPPPEPPPSPLCIRFSDISQPTRSPFPEIKNRKPHGIMTERVRIEKGFKLMELRLIKQRSDFSFRRF